MYEAILLAIGFFVILFATIHDLKTREVPDWLSYSLIIGALGLRLMYSLLLKNPYIISEGILGLIFFVGIGYAMYWMGQWGGGDAKLLMGIGAIVGFNLQSFPEIITLFLLIVFSGALYGITWLTYLGIKHWTKIKPLTKKLLTKNKILGYLSITTGLLSTTTLFYMFGLQPIILIFLILFPTFYILGFTVKSIEKTVFYRKAKPNELVEGDWVVKNIIINGQKIAGPRDLGLSSEQILKLQKLSKQRKIKTVLIKDGIPFVPSFLIAFTAFIITKLFGLNLSIWIKVFSSIV